MSVTPHWSSALTTGFDSQEQYLQLSQAASANLSTTTVYTQQNPQAESYPSKQFNTVEAYQQQTPMVQQSFTVSQTQPLTSIHNPQPLTQTVIREGAYYQPQLSSTQVLEISMPSGAEGVVTYQPQQASSMAGIYCNSGQPQQASVPLVYKAQQPTFSFQNSELQLQSNQVTPLVYNPPQQSSGFLNQQGHNLATNPSHTQTVLNKLVGHESCVHTLNYLEAQIETQKQIGKAQSEQLKALWEQSAHQEQVLKRLKLDCSVKDKTIEELRLQLDASKFAESRKAEVPGLRAVIKEQREEIERLHKKSHREWILDSQKRCEYTNDKKRSPKSTFVGRHHEDVENMCDDVSTLNVNELELSRLQQENQTFRLDIGRLERENSEVAKLRIELLELNRKLLETRPLLNISAGLDQSVSSTDLREQVMVVHRTLSGDQIPCSRTK